MKEGDFVSNFILKDENGNEYDLYKNLDKRVLLAFYPKDDTPVCSTQLAEYNNNLEEFEKNGVKVVGISTDSVDSHEKFCSKLKLNFPLLSDVDKKVSKQFDAINLIGMNKRMLVLIGTDKKVLWLDSTLPVTYIKTGDILEKVQQLNS
ncbi:MAG: peroxiredoxin [Ignavibacteriaceae bacterium]|jgi:peroxiredoxin|nr:peroxiredoxin [Ignavibacteriaceae bacterium]MCU0406108.1 peroxiredoxin [Ignavibacteriaceae bacterium]MCU0413255.1 peroxiredoxin [Ignavibacteriaceae bacterium]